MTIWKLDGDCLAYQLDGTNHQKTIPILTNCKGSLRRSSRHLLRFGKYTANIWIKDETMAVQERRSWGDDLLQWDVDSMTRVGSVLWWWMGLS